MVSHISQCSRILKKYKWMSCCGCDRWNGTGSPRKQNNHFENDFVCAFSVCAYVCVWETRQSCSEIILWNRVWVRKCVRWCVHTATGEFIPGNCRWTILKPGTACLETCSKMGKQALTAAIEWNENLFYSFEHLPVHLNRAESDWAALIVPVIIMQIR